MKHRTAQLYLILFVSVLSPLTAQAADSSYAGQEKRAIKALSEKEIDDYVNGRGMGTSKAAELNQYPGPRHALDEAAKLGFTDEQVTRATEIYKTMDREAIHLGRQIVQKEAELDALFAQKQATPEGIRHIVNELAQLQAQFRLAHLNAHLSMRSILSAEQIALYDSVRGYSGGLLVSPASEDLSHHLNRENGSGAGKDAK